MVRGRGAVPRAPARRVRLRELPEVSHSASPLGGKLPGQGMKRGDVECQGVLVPEGVDTVPDLGPVPGFAPMVFVHDGGSHPPDLSPRGRGEITLFYFPAISAQFRPFCICYLSGGGGSSGGPIREFF